MYGQWVDQDCDWWVKLRHADRHIGLVAELERSYLAAEPWTLEVEPTEQPHVSNLRLRLHETPPTNLVLHAGDALHSMSSALESISYALARVFHGPGFDHDDGLQSLTEFPVKHSLADLEAWARRGRRTELYGEREIRALWWAQSYYWTATAFTEHFIGPEPGSPDEVEQQRFDPLRRLRDLHNIDKHRRLHIALLGPDVPYWGSDGDSQRRANIGGVWRDGEVVAQVYDPPSNANDTDINWGLRVVLVEVGRRDLLVDELRRLHQVVQHSLGSVVQAMTTK